MRPCHGDKTDWILAEACYAASDGTVVTFVTTDELDIYRRLKKMGYAKPKSLKIVHPEMCKHKAIFEYLGTKHAPRI